MRSSMPCGLKKSQSGPASTVLGMVGMERSWIYDATSKEEKTFIIQSGKGSMMSTIIRLTVIEREGFFAKR